jgi:2-dehydropantoate 2-reductase
MKICLYGAGSIGGIIGAHLARVKGIEVSLIARGAHLAAIRKNGLRLISPREDFTVRVAATDNPAELGPQDVVFITLKTHQYLAALDSIVPLLGRETALIPPTTGAPYWFFHKLKGAFEGSRLKRMDPGGRQWSLFGPERALGCAYWAGGVVPEPGVAKLENDVCYLPLGEPDGTASDRVTRLSAAMNEAGLKAPVKSDIRAEIWTKMINSLTWNPIAVLTQANNGDIGKSAGAVEIARRMMVEAEAVAATFGATLATPMEKRIEFTVGLTDHKMSMLTDLQAGKPLEIAALADSIADLSELAKVPTPTIDMMLALLKLRATSSPSTA